ncbi:GAF and ANTAR domain-containing protein [Herbiconiux sp. CPCC 205763]|uniref:GAF and ANTAR domain-containing protein n=1 Tax=Herbiconiux aconitum TaxID=2970913 RepID=A0ABT2GT67_9MICO|nr:GAF and ANTAR domain-containing protein [Herbiconiux aconitum]MCS5718757.1 GAF and ANTAR domain-containing protein [Herbiconiux aconitum]
MPYGEGTLSWTQAASLTGFCWVTGQEDTISKFPVERAPTLCDPFVASLPITRAAISTLKNPFDAETVCASDALAAHLDELQIDLGEGPCWQALSARAPVLVSDLQHTRSPTWPSLHTAIAQFGIHSVFAFPLFVGELDIGAVDLYADTPQLFTTTDVARASALAAAAAVDVLNQALDRRPAHDGDPAQDGPFSRREVHQATGMVIAQMKVSPEDALLLIRARAFADGRSVRDIASQIVNREISFPL